MALLIRNITENQNGAKDAEEKLKHSLYENY